MEMDLLNADGGVGDGSKGKKSAKFQIRVFINMDEDDDGKKGIKPNDMFKRENLAIPFYVDLHIQDHFDCKQLVVDAVQAFNQHLTELSLREPERAKYLLDDDPARFPDNYNLYTASKKKGTAKDDFPSLSLISNVKRTNAEHFSLSCFSSAFIERKSGWGSAAPSI